MNFMLTVININPNSVYHPNFRSGCFDSMPFSIININSSYRHRLIIMSVSHMTIIDIKANSILYPRLIKIDSNQESIFLESLERKLDNPIGLDRSQSWSHDEKSISSKTFDIINGETAVMAHVSFRTFTLETVPSFSASSFVLTGE